jgi:hypothetical protein
LFLFSGPSGNNFSSNIRQLLSAVSDNGIPFKGKVQDVRVSEESVERVRLSLLRSPKKSVRHASRELEMPTMTVWRVSRKRLEMKFYRLHLVQFLQ